MARVTPAAHVDRHQRWMSPGSRFMDTLVWLAVGLVVLMAGATAAVVILAARAGLEAHRETIEVLHMMGSTDIQVARPFQRRIALDTLAGGNRVEEGRGGKEGVRSGRSRWSPYH